MNPFVSWEWTVRSLLGCLLLLVLVTAVQTVFQPAFGYPVRPRNLVIIDRSSMENHRGALIVFRHEPPVRLRLASSPLGFVDPYSAVVLPSGEILVVDAGADPIGLGRPTPVIWKVDPRGEEFAPVELVATSALLQQPVDLMMEPEGTLLLADSNADPNDYGGAPGAVFRVDPESGQIDVLSASPLFVRPQSLARDLDGSIILLDATADPLDSGLFPGAIFRIDPRSGATTIFRIFDTLNFEAPQAIAVLPDGDFLVVDKDADPQGFGLEGGAVFRVPRNGDPPVPHIVDVLFRDPFDIVLGLSNDVWILDASSDADLLGFDLETRSRIGSFASQLTQAMTGLHYALGAGVDSSTVEWNDESGGLLQPGDFVTVRARVNNTGTVSTSDASMVDTLGVEWDFVAGSDSISAGESSFDPLTRIFRWSGELDVGEEVQVRFRMRLRDTTEPGTELLQRVTFRADGSPYTRTYKPVVETRFEPGTILFMDMREVLGEDIGLIFAVNADTIGPTLVHAGAPLVQPEDSEFLDDGRLVIFDQRAVPVEGSGSQAIFIYDAAAQTFETVWTRQEGDGLVAPSGIALESDGSILMVDRDANPFGFPYDAQPFPPPGDLGPGAVFRISEDGEAIPVFGDSLMIEPVDLDVANDGTIVVVDFGGRDSSGDIWEYSPGGVVSRRELLSNWFRDPLGIALDETNRAYVADPTYFNEGAGEDRGTLLLVVRRSPTAFGILNQSSLMVDPTDCYLHTDGYLYVADRDADPLELGAQDPGAIFKIEVGAEIPTLEIASASFSFKRPDGISGLASSEILASSVILEGAGPTGVSPGDTVSFSIRVTNPSGRDADQTLIDMQFSGASTVVEAFAQEGVSALDPDGLSSSWTGTVAKGRSVRFETRVVVSSELSYGAVLRADASVDGVGMSFESSVESTILSPFRQGEIVLVDEAADPSGVGGSPGAVFGLGGKGDPVRLIHTGAPFRDPAAVEWTTDGELLIADKQSNEPGEVYRVDTTTGELVPIVSGDERLKSPVDLLWAENGDLLIVDSDATFDDSDGKGAIFRLNGLEGPLEIFSVSEQFQYPFEATFDAEGRLFLTDQQANPRQLEALRTSAIFEIDPETGAVLESHQYESIPDATGILALPDSSFVITDPFANPRQVSGSPGALFLFRPGAQDAEVLLASPEVIRPFRTYRRTDGKLLVMDSQARAPTGNPGLVFEFDPETRVLREYAWSDSFRFSLRDMALQPTSVLGFDRYEVNDPSGAPVYPADRLQLVAELENTGPLVATSVVFVDDLPDEGVLIAESVSATSGEVVVTGNEVRWSGDIAPGASVEIRYQLQLDPFRAAEQVLAFSATAVGPAVGQLERKVLLPVFVALDPHTIFLADSDADPFEIGLLPGAIFKIDQRTGATTPYFSAPEFRHPVDVAVSKGPGTKLYVLDQHAVVGVGRGALFGLDPATLELSVAATDSSWFWLVDILMLSDTRALVLDQFADPFGLTTGLGPGAIYEVDLERGESSVLFSDISVTSMTGMALLPDGDLAICDRDADPDDLGTRPGAVYRLDLSSGNLSLLAKDERWVDPISIAVGSDGEILLLDRTSTPDPESEGTGSLWQIDPNGEVREIVSPDHFRRPATILTQVDGTPLVSDAESDLFGQGATGALFRWNPLVATRFVPLAVSEQMRTPAGMAIYQDVTPVVSLIVEAGGSEDGIWLEWEGLSDLEEIRYLIYRRPAVGPDDPGDESPEGYDLLPSARDFVGFGPHRFLDSQVEPAAWYVYLIAIAYSDGATDYSQPIVAQSPAGLARLELRAPTPNPVRPPTTLRFSVPRGGGKVTLSIHDVSGRRVRSLHNGELPPGGHQRIWNGKSDSGHGVAAGIYFARLALDGRTRTQRLVVLR